MESSFSFGNVLMRRTKARQSFDDRRNQIGGQWRMGAASQDHRKFPPADLLRQFPHQGRDLPVAGTGEADVAVVALVRVEAEIPEQQIGPESANPGGDVLRPQVE